MKETKEGMSLKDKVFSTAGAVSAITLVALIVSILNILPEEINYILFFLISLPVAVTFIFSIFVNQPNARIRARKYGFIFYFAIILTLYFIRFTPDSFSNFLDLGFKFLIAMAISVISGLFYYIPFVSLKKKSFRLRAIVSFVFSLAVTITAAVLFRSINFDFIS